MKKREFSVLAECVDQRSGKRYLPGDIFDPAPSASQARRLVAAGCLPAGAIEAAEKLEADGGGDPAAIARAQLNHDGLFDRSDDELSALVLAEGVSLKGVTDRTGIIAAIRSARNPSAATTSRGAEDDGLDRHTVAELRGIAEAENIEIGADLKKAEIVEAIRAGRAAV